MALAPDIATSTDINPVEDSGTHVNAPQLRGFVMALFFIFGGITSLNDVIIAKLKELFTLKLHAGGAGAVLLLRRKPG